MSTVSLITVNHSAPCSYMCAQFYGYILPADETVVFYQKKMKHDCYVPVVRQVALDNVPLRNSSSFQNLALVKNLC